MNFFNRFSGLFFSPQEVFKAISEKPVWVDALVVLLIFTAVFSYIIGPYSQKDSLQTMQNNIKLRERLGEEKFNQMIENMKNPSKTTLIIQRIFIAPLSIGIGFVFSSLIIFILGRFISVEGKFAQIFSAYLHANFIDKILGNAIRLILIISRGSVIQTTTSIAFLFPKLEITSPAYIILSQIDFFQLWLFGILGFGLSYVFKIEFKKALIISYGFWLLKTVLYIVLGFLSLQFMG